jgi:hypothetical protein
MKLIFTAAIFYVFILQSTGQNKATFSESHHDIHKILVKEVLQTTSYTYLHTEETGRLQWLAVPKMEAREGETYYYQGGVEMGEFKSKELDRNFSSILFLDGVISPDIVEGGKTSLKTSAEKPKSTEEKIGVDIKPVTGGITISELLSNKEKYSNKVVKIKGKVTRFNSRIMNRNWIHLQDGTSSSGEFDVTATSADDVIVGDVITIEGIISLNKDFGAGYYYKIIMEDGKVSKE